MPELAHAVWRKSSRSAAGNCVEVARDSAWAAIRDSKNPAGPALIVPATTFGIFTERIKTGRFDQ